MKIGGFAGMRRDDEGVTATVEYILTFIIASGIFALLIMNFNPLFVSTPQDIVTRDQLADIGNDVTTKVIDTYLVLPDNGNITTYFEIPNTVAAGYTYDISIEEMSGKNRLDKEVRVSTSDGRIVRQHDAQRGQPDHSHRGRDREHRVPS